MPQMSPLNWIIISPMAIFILMLVMSSLYFLFMKKINPKMNTSTKTLNMKFMW